MTEGSKSNKGQEDKKIGRSHLCDASSTLLDVWQICVSPLLLLAYLHSPWSEGQVDALPWGNGKLDTDRWKQLDRNRQPKNWVKYPKNGNSIESWQEMGIADHRFTKKNHASLHRTTAMVEREAFSWGILLLSSEFRLWLAGSLDFSFHYRHHQWDRKLRFIKTKT